MYLWAAVVLSKPVVFLTIPCIRSLFLFPCLTTTSFATQPLSLRAFPKANLHAAFSHSQCKKHFQHFQHFQLLHGVTTVNTRQSGIKVSTFQLTYSNPLQLCSQCTMMQNKVSLLKCQQFICTAAGWGCPYGWCTSAKVAATFTRRFCFIRLSSAALLGLCSQSFFQPHLSVQQPSLNICRVSSVTN